MNPKVFISHASEDKARFVTAFAERLRASGVDAWLDRWEMLPGDSLVDKIFEEGLRNASAVVVILSVNSVNKPWVREELNAAFVKRVNTGSKLIPIVLDDCAVPEALASTVWERVANLASYDASFGRILAAVTGSTEKPPLDRCRDM
ncbi:MAG: toll/interleukin-1 receptor domain-containing protein [Pseudomonadota bacterium]